MGLFDKVTAIFKKEGSSSEKTANNDYSSMGHSTEAVNEVDYLYAVMQVENNRRAILKDVQLMLSNDPLVDETNARLGRKTVRGGIYCIVSGSGKHQSRVAAKTGAKARRGANVANKAQQIIDALWARCKIDSAAALWVSKMIADGDIFLNIIVEEYEGRYRIKAIRLIPPLIMKRNENEFGEFEDISKAFSEIDPNNSLYYQTIVPERAKRHFPLWAINHIRWKYRGGLYGNSQYTSIRKLSKQNLGSDDDMVVRRKTRAPQRRVHSVGNKDKPGDPTVVNEYNAAHRDSIVNGKYTPNTDYYHNGLGDVKNLDGDGNLGEIRDVQYLYNKQNVGTVIPKGLAGFSEDINRDVLEDQKEELFETIEDIRTILEYGDGGPFSGLRAIVELELRLQGLDPDVNGIEFDITFNTLKNEPPKDLIERTRIAREAGLIDLRTAVVQISHVFNAENPEHILEALAEEQDEAAAKMKKEKKDFERGEKDEEDEPIEDQSLYQDAEDYAHLKGLDKIERKALKTLKKRFSRIHKAIKKHINSWEGPITDAESTLSKKDIDKFIEAVTKIHSDDEEVTQAELKYVYTDSAKIGGVLAAAAVGISFDIAKDDIIEDLLENAGKRIKGVDETTLKEIRLALAEAEMDKASITQMKKKLAGVVDEVFANAYHNRLEMIARTETMWAYNESALRTYAAGGVDTTNAPGLPAHPRCRCAYSSRNGKVIILVVGDERTCPVCRSFIDEEY
jgi:hypothetical protein